MYHVYLKCLVKKSNGSYENKGSTILVGHTNQCDDDCDGRSR